MRQFLLDTTLISFLIPVIGFYARGFGPGVHFYAIPGFVRNPVELVPPRLAHNLRKALYLFNSRMRDFLERSFKAVPISGFRHRESLLEVRPTAHRPRKHIRHQCILGGILLEIDRGIKSIAIPESLNMGL